MSLSEAVVQILEHPLLSHFLVLALGLLVGVYRTRYRASLRIRERVAVRRFEAHEALQGITEDIRTMTQGAGPFVDRYPEVLESYESFTDWRTRFSRVFHEHEQWLDSQVRQHLYLLQDYIVCLTKVVQEDEVDLAELRSDIGTDLIPLSRKLEVSIRKFFASRIHRLDLPEVPGHHKLPQKETASILESTSLYQGYGEHFPTSYQRLIGAYSSQGDGQ